MGTIRQDKKRQQQSDLDKKQNKEQSKSKAREETQEDKRPEKMRPHEVRRHLSTRQDKTSLNIP